MEKTKILKEISRDIIALGSPIFFVFILIRVSIAQDQVYLSQFIFAGILFLVLMFLLKSSIYSGLGLIALIFTSIFYNYLPYTIFGSLVYIGLIFSLIYLKKDKKEIFKGILFGLVSSTIGYYLVDFIFS
tara:strand:- start:1273 stop:1662 length:390 start_codon:yes stop_codon:yes gene_type:complete